MQQWLHEARWEVLHEHGRCERNDGVGFHTAPDLLTGHDYRDNHHYYNASGEYTIVPSPLETTEADSATLQATATDWLVNAEIAKRNITGFKAATLGTNTNAIASWFNTNSTIDSTNGELVSQGRFPSADASSPKLSKLTRPRVGHRQLMVLLSLR